MRKILLFVLFAFPAVALAAGSANITINPNIPYVSSGADFPSLIQGFYLYALAIGGILAFGAIVYGGVKYATGRGNPSTESEGKSWITSALLGLLLLGGAYIVLHTVNPALTILSMPGLPALSAASSNSVTGPTAITTYGCLANNGVYACSTSGKDSTCSDAQGCSGRQCKSIPTSYCGQSAAAAAGNCIPTSGGEGKYSGIGTAGSPDSWSPGLKAVIACVQPAISTFGLAPYTTNGQHVCDLTKTPPSISCHFGGQCSDGGHALDIDVNNDSLTLLQKAKSIAEQCGVSTHNQVTCRCESQNGAQLDPSCTQSYDNHVHCNVNNASCGCN